MKWILGIVCLLVLGYGMSEAGLFFNRRASSNACAVPAASCAGAVQAAPAACVGAVQAAPAAGCAGVQRIRERRILRVRAGGC